MVSRRKTAKSRTRKRPAASPRGARAKALARKPKARTSARAPAQPVLKKKRRRKPGPTARKPAAAPQAPASPNDRRLQADRARLGLGRGEDMAVAAADVELRADRQLSRDAVHERDLSGS